MTSILLPLTSFSQLDPTIKIGILDFGGPVWSLNSSSSIDILQVSDKLMLYIGISISSRIHFFNHYHFFQATVPVFVITLIYIIFINLASKNLSLCSKRGNRVKQQCTVLCDMATCSNHFHHADIQTTHQCKRYFLKFCNWLTTRGKLQH